MRRNGVLRYVILGGLVWISSVALQLLFPTILSSRLLFGGLVALLLVGGLVMVVISAREMFRR